MPSITCTHCGAVLKTKDPVPPGKKVKCPKCAQAFIVPDEEELPAEPTAIEPDDDAGEMKPSKKKSDFDMSDDADPADGEGDGKASKKGGKDKKKNNTIMIVGIVVAVLLLCCCTPSCVGVILNWTAIVGGGATTKAFDKAFEDAMRKQQEDMLKAQKK